MSRRRLVTAVVLVLALVASGCGGDDGGGGDGGAAGQEPAGEPQAGGSLVVAVEAEIDGFDPSRNRLPVSGLIYANTVFDPLTAQNAEGDWVPYLAESVEPNTDHTAWTITARPGVTFHDGTPFNADAIKLNLDNYRQSPQNGASLRLITSVDKVDDMTVQVTLSSPWVPFPAYLAYHNGFMRAPSMIEDPDGSRNPVGTGPFVFEEWVPGQRFRATKNADYWRADEGLPYLDEIEFRPIPDGQARVNALLSGQVDLLHTSAPQQVLALREAGDQINLVEYTEGATEENLLLLNTVVAPFDSLTARQALAHAVDVDRLIETVTQGISERATTPFSGQDEYPLPEGYPEYDPDEAERLVAQYEDETGEPLAFTYSSALNPDPSAQLIQDMLGEVGIEMEIEQVDQSQLINDALLGDFQLSGWRQFGAADPDLEFVWWDIDNTPPPGQIALNYGRFRNEELQAVMQSARENPDEEARRASYGDVAQIFADELPYLFTTRTMWVAGSQPDVGGVTTSPLPDGSEADAATIGPLFRPVGLYRAE